MANDVLDQKRNKKNTAAKNTQKTLYVMGVELNLILCITQQLTFNTFGMMWIAMLCFVSYHIKAFKIASPLLYVNFLLKRVYYVRFILPFVLRTEKQHFFISILYKD